MSRRHVMTTRRRAALRKAQIASARKRRKSKISPKTKRRVKRAAIAAGIAYIYWQDIRWTNTNQYLHARYSSGMNYRDLPKEQMEYERRHMKHRQRAVYFGNGRSTFAKRRKRQAQQRKTTKARIEKLGFPTYAYRMTRNHTRYNPYVNHYLTKLGKTGFGMAVKKTPPVRKVQQANFKRSVLKTIREL